MKLKFYSYISDDIRVLLIGFIDSKNNKLVGIVLSTNVTITPLQRKVIFDLGIHKNAFIEVEKDKVLGQLDDEMLEILEILKITNL